MSQRLVWNFEFSPASIPQPFNLIQDVDELKWEIRYFWEEDRIICLSNWERDLLDLGNYQQKHKEDYYYLLPDENYNIKRRRNELLYKPLIQSSGKALGFGAKINLDSLHNAPALQKIRRQLESKGIEIAVKKESFTYKFTSTPTIKLELARLEVNNKVYFSLCIEGKSLPLVQTINESILDEQTSCDYVTFLKSIIKS